MKKQLKDMFAQVTMPEETEEKIRSAMRHTGGKARKTIWRTMVAAAAVLALVFVVTPRAWAAVEDWVVKYFFPGSDLTIYEQTDKNGNVDFYCFTQDSFVPCISNGKYGIVNNGVVTTPFEYDYIQSHQEGSVGVYLAVKDGKIYYINSNGTVLTPEGFTCGSAPCGNRAWVFQGDKGFVLEFN